MAPGSAAGAGVAPGSAAGAGVAPAGAAGAGAAPGGAAEQRSRRWYAVPNIAYDSDDGLGFGARGELAFDAPGYEPYRTAYVLHIFATLRGYHHHRFRFDRVGLGPGQRLRLTAHLAWRQWLNDGYWGVGNGTARERAYVGDLADDDPGRKRYRYSLFQPFGHVTLRAGVSPRVSLFGALNVKYSVVRTYAGSLLAEQQPYGMQGGVGTLLSAGAIYDSRRPEVDPERGIFAELSGRVAAPMPHGAGAFQGLLASLRGYLSPTPWLTLAGRAMAEWLFGQVPFYEMVHWGGSVPVAGFGGFETLRGISFGRWRAPGKAVLNLEARLRVLEHLGWGKRFCWQLGLFTDAGVVWGEGQDATAPAPAFPLHPAAGGGVRLIYEEVFVGRIDTGLGLDPVREADGGLSQELSWGLYVVFDHAF